MSPSILADARERAARAGLNLFGVLDAERFDRCQPKEQRIANLMPDCGTVVVLGTGGRSVAASITRSPAPTSLASTSLAPASLAPASLAPTSLAPTSVVPFDAIVGAAANEVAAVVRSAGSCRVVLANSGAPLSFSRLGEAAGLGTVSPVSGLFLHPEFGPWLRLRAALLVVGRPFGCVEEASIVDRFHPCCACARPCVSACPASAIDGHGHQDIGRCSHHRQLGGCESACSSRSACPVGHQHRDEPGQPLHGHSMPLVPARRVFGIAFWRLVPRAWRRGW